MTDILANIILYSCAITAVLAVCIAASFRKDQADLEGDELDESLSPIQRLFVNLVALGISVIVCTGAFAVFYLIGKALNAVF